MNRKELDVMNAIRECPLANQRELAEYSGHSLGIVNQSVNYLTDGGYLDSDQHLTGKAIQIFKEGTTKRAFILAEETGMRIASLNTQIPKPLLEIRGQRFIERLITQLHQAGVYEIYIVVGFLKEKFEYLIDKFQVDLVVNTEYARKGSLHSLSLVLDHISDCYIVPGDVWFQENPFRKCELYSWYMVGNTTTIGSHVRLNRQKELVSTSDNGNIMTGLCYLTESFAMEVRQRISQYSREYQYSGAGWDVVLFGKNGMLIDAKIVNSESVITVTTYEQLKEENSSFQTRKAEAISRIADTFHVKPETLGSINLIKKGMTNYSYWFSCHGNEYVMRLPGEDQLLGVDRLHEKEVYERISPLHISDDVVMLHPETGLKVSQFIKNTRACDAGNLNDVRVSMEMLRSVHDSNLQVSHSFCVWEEIDFYETLWPDGCSMYQDYQETKQKVCSLKKYLDDHPVKQVLCHINPAAENFLFYLDGEGKEVLRLIDWERGAMSDPCVDIAMFCLDALHNRSQVEKTIDSYFSRVVSPEERIRIYCYMAAGGLMWSNWCEYKQSLGVEFGQYSLSQYRYAKEYYRLANDLIQSKGD